MATLTESAIETFAIKLFERLGYDAIHAPDSAPDSDTPAVSAMLLYTSRRPG